MGKHKCPPFQTMCQTFCLHGSLNLGQVEHAFHKPIIIVLVLNDNKSLKSKCQKVKSTNTCWSWNRVNFESFKNLLTFVVYLIVLSIPVISEATKKPIWKSGLNIHLANCPHTWCSGWNVCYQNKIEFTLQWQ